MKRPLCLVCFFYALIVALYVYGRQRPSFSLPESGEQAVTLSGQLKQMEHQNGITRMYLNHLTCDSSQSKLYSQLQEFPQAECICYLKETIPAEEEEGSRAATGIGRRLTVTGRIGLFSGASNPGEFDYQAYLSSERILFGIWDTRVISAEGSANPLMEGLARIRGYGGKILAHFLPEADAGVFKAMLLGDRTGISEEDSILFRQSGTAHILAISGLHISLIGMGVYSLLRVLHTPVCIGRPVCCLFVLCYGLMTGMSGSAVRAVSMFMIRQNGERVGRSYDVLTALSMTAAVLLTFRPLSVYQSGFWLSFLAILGIACLKPALEQIFGKGRNGFFRKCRSAFYAGFAVTLTTLPVILYSYYEYSPYALFINLLVLPAVGIAAVCGGGVLILGMLPGNVAAIPAAVCRGVLVVLRTVLRGVLKLPGALIIFGRPAIWQIMVYGVFLLLFLIYASYVSRRIEFKKKNMKRKVLGILCLALTLTMLLIRPYTGLTITVLDVGQGDGICIELGGGRAVLIDGGSSDQSKLAHYRLIPYLKSRGIHTVEAVFLTHLDRDHISGILELLAEPEGIAVERIGMSAGVVRDEAWQELIKAAGEAGAEIFYLQSGDICSLGVASLICLYPDVEQAEGGAMFETEALPDTADRNAASMILLLSYGNFDALFTGDADETGEWEALLRIPEGITCEFLKIAHHGSASSSGEAFLEKLKPQFAVISCGLNNPYGHPSQQTLKRLACLKIPWITTAEHGAVSIWTDGEHYKVYSYK